MARRESIAFSAPDPWLPMMSSLNIRLDDESVLPLVYYFEVIVCAVGPIRAYRQTKPEVHDIATLPVEDRDTAINSTQRKFGNVWMYGLGDMLADRQTRRLIIILCFLTGAK